VTDLGLLTTKEAAELLRLSPSALQKLRNDGQVPFVKLGKKVFYKRDALVRFVDDQQLIYPTSEGDK
jgi:excisionase family DNA binding protein